MKIAPAAIGALVLLVLSAHRLPAPIMENKPSPTEAPSKPKAASAKHNSNESSGSKSITRFDGTWRATKSAKTSTGNTFTDTKTIVIKNGTAFYTFEKTGILAPGKKWTDIPSPYNSISPIFQKWTDKAIQLKAEGSNLKTRWPGNKLIDWSPKTIPIGAFKSASGKPNDTISILNGDQMIVTSGKGAVTYTRVR